MTTSSTQKDVTFLRSEKPAPSPFCGSRWTHCAPSNSPHGATVSRISIDQVLKKCFRLIGSAEEFLQNSAKHPYLSKYPNFDIQNSGSVPVFSQHLAGLGYDRRILGHKRDGVPLGSSGHRSSGEDGVRR